MADDKNDGFLIQQYAPNSKASCESSFGDVFVILRLENGDMLVGSIYITLDGTIQEFIDIIFDVIDENPLHLNSDPSLCSMCMNEYRPDFPMQRNTLSRNSLRLESNEATVCPCGRPPRSNHHRQTSRRQN